MTGNPALAHQDDARTLYQFGLSEQAAGRTDRAIEYFDAALRLKPDFPEALCSGGYILQVKGHVDGALAFYGRAAELDPRYFLAWFNRGQLLLQCRRHEEALACIDRALAIQPRDAGALSNRGVALYRLGRAQEAADALAEALAIEPGLAEARLNLASALRRLGRFDEAGRHFLTVLKADPRDATAHCGFGIVARELGRYEEARAAYKRALALDPQLDEAASSLGCLELLMGEFETGWEGYEHRWTAGERLVASSDARFDAARPETMAGRRVLVVNDHGLGDTIQFARYMVMLAQGGAQVTFAGPAKMRRLLSSSGVRIDFRDTGDIAGDYDARIAISSLPRAFSTRLETIPAPVPYLAAEPERAAFWRARMDEMAGPGLKIGLCWRGSQDFRVDPRRSIPPAALAPLTAVNHARFFALHMDVQDGELPPELASRVHVFGDGFDRGPDAFIDTAAVMAGLDLIVTCDTSIAHLAGALGRPVFVALRHLAEWRWMRERADSPWYPTMRLFRAAERKGKGDDWPGLFEDIAREIEGI